MPHILDGKGHLKGHLGQGIVFLVQWTPQDSPSLSPLAMPQPLAPGGSFSLGSFLTASGTRR